MPVRSALLVVVAAVLGGTVGCIGSSTNKSAPPAGSSRRPPPTTTAANGAEGAVVYGVGVSTDPYGRSRSDRGFGVVTGLVRGRLSAVRAGDRWNGQTVRWIAPGVIQVERARSPRQALFAYRDGRLALRQVLSLPWRLRATIAWSPDRTELAAEPSMRVSCGAGAIVHDCTAASGRILIQRGSGSTPRHVARGDLLGWTPAGRVVFRPHARSGEADASPIRTVDPHTGTRQTLLTAARVARRADAVGRVFLEAPVWSQDRRYLAMLAAIQHRRSAKLAGDTIVLAHADGRIIRFFASPYIISMFAWSPRGHRLAYTTSGFPEPHQLFVVNRPESPPRRLFQTTDRHFDWITWSPDDRWLLIDDENDGHWRLLSSSTGHTTRLLPRLGGRPLWCCPQNPYYARYAD